MKSIIFLPIHVSFFWVSEPRIWNYRIFLLCHHIINVNTNYILWSALIKIKSYSIQTLIHTHICEKSETDLCLLVEKLLLPYLQSTTITFTIVSRCFKHKTLKSWRKNWHLFYLKKCKQNPNLAMAGHLNQVTVWVYIYR